MHNKIIVGGIYEHYKGKRYKVIAIAFDADDPTKKQAIYQSLYDCPDFGPQAMWSRGLDGFSGIVVINGVEKKRFFKVD